MSNGGASHDRHNGEGVSMGNVIFWGVFWMLMIGLSIWLYRGATKP